LQSIQLSARVYLG